MKGEFAASSKHKFPQYFITVVDGNRAYSIVSASSHSKAMNEFLSQMFSKKLEI